jgi:methylmalonyl-CoA mutase
MDQNTNNTQLFSEFPPVSTELWEATINKDLKGADYDHKLVWKTDEGFKVQPYYREEDLAKLEHLDVLPDNFPFIRGNKKQSNDWYIRQDIKVKDLKEANKMALNILMKGVTSLGLNFDEKFEPTEEIIIKATENIFADAVELNFKFAGNAHKVPGIVVNLAKNFNRDLNKIHGSVDIDPIGELVLIGKFLYPQKDIFNLAKTMIEDAEFLPHFKVLTISGDNYHNSGSTIVQELAFSLAHATNYLTQLTERGLSINKIAPRIKFRFAAGSNYFMEIAKLRAARWLWAQIVKAYGPCNDSIAEMNIHACTSNWNKTVYDPYVNMLRTTTESMSSIIGGANSLTVSPFDNAFKDADIFSERIARNQQLLLKEESYLDKVVDPGAGSYYIEQLTDSIATQAWNLFLEVQEKGGFIEAFKAEFIQSSVKEAARKKDMDIATRKTTLLGTNQYPNPIEHLEKMEEIISSKPIEHEGGKLIPYRGAQAFEALRYATDKFAQKEDRPKVFMLTIGNLTMRKARAQFSNNFFGCAGFELIDNNGYNTIEEGVEAYRKSKADIVVLCSSDDEYASYAPDLYNLLKDEAIIVIAGYPKVIIDELRQKGLQHFIHVKSDVLQTLSGFQKELGIK